MRQTSLSVALEVKPASADHLSVLLDALRARRGTDASGAPGRYAPFLDTVPVLHFLSLSMFPGFDYDPLFVIEANFDGAPGPFWAQIEAGMAEDLRAILRCCKRPLDADGPLYDAVTAPGSRAPVAPYLEARALRPTVFHHGNRGLTRDRILDEAALFDGVRAAIGADQTRYRGLAPPVIHAALRTALAPRFATLASAQPPRIGTWENLADWTRLIAFGLGLILLLSVPGLVLKLALPWERYLVLLVVAFGAFGLLLKRIGVPLPGTGIPTHFSFARLVFRQLVPLAIGVLAYLVLAVAVGTPLSMLLTGRSLDAAARGMFIWLAWGLVAVPVVAAGLVLWLRFLERRDAAQDAPPVDPRMLREMARREDWIPQNHMGSIVLVKPGVLRTILLRAGHLGLGLLLRIIARDGYLGSMRTIHFAHWALVNNNSRLMFFSNFDQTWESYLDDFIEKAHAGLTLAWSNGVGFPPTRFLVKDGASHGRQFKEWARHSMTVSRFWYSAYRNLTADQIERNYRIALGLRKSRLSDKEAAQWILDL